MLRSLLLFILSLTAPVCFGNTVLMSFTALPTTHESNTYSSSTNASYNGYSTATIAGIPSQDVMCDFFDAETPMPSGPWTYDYSTIGSAGWASTVQFQTGETIKNTTGATLDGVANNHTLTLTETQSYQTAAVLMAEMQTYLNGNPASPGNTVTDFQYAVWYLFNQNLSLNGASLTLNNNQQTDLFNAAAIVTSSTQTNRQITAADSAKLVIYTYPAGTEQEFLGELTPTGAAPEPASWALFGVLGLLLIPGVRSKVLAFVSRS
jgi:hypothetical protein